MRKTIWILAIALMAVGIMIAQAPVDPPTGQFTKGNAKAIPRNPIQSPASVARPQTVTPQSYPLDQIQAGEVRFGSRRGFCHGRDAAGGETGPDLTRSELVSADTRGDKIGPLLR
jgi:hypothetical protein